MRESAWRLTWNPVGATPRVLLDFGDEMEEEIARDLSQLVDVMRYDQAVNARPYGRANRKRRLEFTRHREFATPAAAWQALLESQAADPWGEKSLLRIERLGGGSTIGRAAVLSANRQPTTDGLGPGLLERFAMRVDGGLPLVGNALTIVGGWFNPPTTEGGTGSGGITIIVDDDDHALTPGDVVYVTGVNGVPNGHYPVTGVTGNQVTVDAPTSNTPAGDAGDLVGEGVSGYVAHTGHIRIKGYGLGDGASYTYRINSGAPMGFDTISSGIGVGATLDYTSQIVYEVWYDPDDDGPVLGGTNPLPIDGQSHPNGIGSQCVQSGPSTVSVQLYRNGTAYGAAKTFNPAWTASKTYGPGPSGHVVPGLGTLVITLHGPGSGGVDDPPGIGAAITSGSIQKAE